MTRILSLDDDPDVVSLIGLILKRAGYEHLGTRDSHEAWAMLHTHPIDLFTQDLMRPDMDGWKFYEQMKSDEALRDIPVIILTAKAQSVDKDLGLQAFKVDGYIAKPFGPQELLAAIREALTKRGKPLPSEVEYAHRKSLPRKSVRERIAALHLDLSLFLPFQKRRKSVQERIAALQDVDPEVRLSAVRLLGEIGDKRAAEPFIEMLEDEHGEIRLAIVTALGMLGDTRAVEPLIRVLREEAWTIRWSAAMALGRIKNARAVEPLIAALSDQSSIVRMIAALALGEIKDERAVEPLAQALADEDNWVRWTVAKALRQIKGARS
ncbi:MAG TPA: HEAT repeat domain-containing protein [Anaerolineae bacterium]|nr:HEAT repeat domain-containing protein [Anaerolineae bacterium]